MVIEDPDFFEDDEELGIDIYEPGSFIERDMDWSRFSQVLLLVLGGWVLMFILQVIIIIPLIPLIGLFEILTNPWALIIVTIAEVGFVIPPIWYVKRNGISIKSIGINRMSSIRDILLGLVFGVMMILSNIVISWLMSLAIPGISGDETLFYPPTDSSLYLWLASWIFAMFIFVGFTEELIFRGFLQRRMELYYRTKGSKNYKMIALVITSFIFSAIHLEVFGLATRFVLGLFLGYLAQRRGYSILGPTVAHGFNNSAIVILALFVP